MKCRKTVTYTTNLFIELNVQQRRHVSALFYGAIFRSSMVLIRKLNNPRGGCYTLWVTVDVENENSFLAGRGGGSVFNYGYS